MSRRHHVEKPCDVSTLHGDDPIAIRQQVLEHVRVKTGAAATAFCSYIVNAEGDPEMSAESFAAPGDYTPLLRHYAALMRNRSFREENNKTFTFWTPAQHKQIERKSFLSMNAMVPRPKFLASRFYNEIYRPFDVHDQIRILVYQGPRLVAWVGAIKDKRSKSLFGTDDQRMLQESVAPICNAIVHADQLLASDTPTSVGDFILTANGSVEHLSDAGREWLGRPGLLKAVQRCVAEFDRGQTDATTHALDRLSLRLVRLDGSTGVRYLCSLSPASTVQLSPIDQLSPNLHKVAVLAAQGLSDKEIAAKLEKAISTVRTYMQRTLKQLQIGDRRELMKMANR